MQWILLIFTLLSYLFGISMKQKKKLQIYWIRTQCNYILLFTSWLRYNTKIGIKIDMASNLHKDKNRFFFHFLSRFFSYFVIFFFINKLRKVISSLFTPLITYLAHASPNRSPFVWIISTNGASVFRIASYDHLR